MVLESILSLASIPITIATVEGIRHQREKEKKNKDADEQYRMRDFHLDVYCSANSRKRDEVDKTIVILRDGKLYLAPKDPDTKLPLPCPGRSKVDHPFTGFYLDFQPEAAPGGDKMFERLNRPPPFRGLVSTISSTPRPSLNWIYIDKYSFELRYGSRAQANGHILGPWDWTDDEVGLTMEGWEGFVAVEEEKGVWAVHYDRDDDRLEGRVRKGTRVLQCSLERRVIEDEEEEEEIIKR